MSTGSVAVGGSDEDLRSLAKWLRDEDALRGRVSLAERPVAAGQMGGVLDSVVVVLTSANAGLLVKSLFGWLGRRREAAGVALKVRNARGAEIELKCGSAADATAVIDDLRAFLVDGE
jgi:Effector Associated Constant Component 1